MKKLIVFLSLILVFSIVFISCDMSSSGNGGSDDDNEIVSNESGFGFKLNWDGTYTLSSNELYDATEVTIPTSFEGKPVTAIGDYALSGLNEVKSLVIPNGITHIGEGAFSSCSSLESIVIPDSVVSIGREAFSYCESLESIDLSDNIMTLPDYCFESTAYYQNDANWEDGVLYVDNHLIEARDSVSGTYSVKSGTKTICADAFYGCDSLEGIVIPDGVVAIGDRAFLECYNLQSITLPDSLIYVGVDAFIGTGYLMNDANLTSDGAVYIGNILVYVDWEVSNFNVREGTKIIGSSAFQGCEAYEITIPEGVVAIGAYAFSGCSNLESLTIPASVEYAGNYMYYSTSGIKHIEFAKNSKCTSLGLQCFASLHDLESIVLPDSLESIDERCLAWCPKLVSVDIPASVKYIGESAFEDCESLSSINFAGSEDNWNAIYKDSDWAPGAGDFNVNYAN